MTIISYEHEFIFIKTRKVAGTSVEACLRSVLGPDDIVPCVTPRDEFFSASNGHFSRNYARDPADEERYTELVLNRDFDGAMEFLRSVRKKYVSHMSAGKVRQMIGATDFDRFFKFSIERHPYSWLVSGVAYDNKAYNAGQPSRKSLEDIRESIRVRLSKPDFATSLNADFYHIDGRLAVDRVVRYENLQADLDEVFESIGISPTVQLPRLKENPLPFDLEEIIDPELKSLVAEKCDSVFAEMGYAV